MYGKWPMNLFADLEEIVKYDVPMAEHTWFRLGGPARYYVAPTSKDQLLEVVHRCHNNNVPLYVLGRGSNLLVSDKGVDGVVVRLSHDCFCGISIEDNIVRAGAGTDLSILVRQCARAGLSGLEYLAGIPGSVGGSVKINAGGRFGDIGSVVQSVELMDSSGYLFNRQRGDIFFGYRMTNIMAKFILEASFALSPDDPEQIGKMLKEVWLLKRNSQPLNGRNAGCVFKNPRAVSAGALIDKAGLKNTRVGGALISERHANFIIAEPGATASDVLKLIDIVKDKILKRFDMELELEIDIWQ